MDHAAAADLLDTVHDHANESSVNGITVRQVVLDSLVREKQRLSGQLLRGDYQMESRDAEVVGNSIKVHDLHAIAELNKSATARVQQRQYHNECVVQQLQREKDELQVRLDRMQHRGVAAFRMRRRQRYQRATFAEWVRGIFQQRQRQVCILRVLLRARKQQLRCALAQWRERACVNDSSGPAMNPSKLNSPIGTALNAAIPHEVVYGTCNEDEEKRQPREATAETASQTTMHNLTRSSVSQPGYSSSRSQSESSISLLLAWQLDRRRRLHRAVTLWKSQLIRHRTYQRLVQSTCRRKLSAILKSWRNATTLSRSKHDALGRILRARLTKTRRLAFMRLRLRSLESWMHEWMLVLRAAGSALEEERSLFTSQQEDALAELQRCMKRQDSLHEHMMAAQHRRMRSIQRAVVLRSSFLQWRSETVTKHRLQLAMARQYYQASRQRRRHLMWSHWRALLRQNTLVARFTARTQRRRRHSRLVHWFHVLALGARRRAIRRRFTTWLVTRYRRHRLAIGWRCWRKTLVEATQQMRAAHQSRELMTRLQSHEQGWQCERRRLQTVTYRYQLQCAFGCADAKRERLIRAAFISWKERVAMLRARRSRLVRIVRHKARHALGTAWARWTVRVSHHQHVLHAVQSVFPRRRMHSIARAVIQGWRVAVHKQRRAMAHTQALQLAVLLWRAAIKSKHLQATFLTRFLSGRAVHWQRIALQRWRLHLTRSAWSERYQRGRALDLVTRVWGKWLRVHLRSLGYRRRQQATIGTLLETRGCEAHIRSVWHAWRQVVYRSRDHRKVVDITARRWKQMHDRSLMSNMWSAWRDRKRQQRQLRRAMTQRERFRARQQLTSRWEQWRRVVLSVTAKKIGYKEAISRLQRVRVTAQYQRYSLKALLDGWKKVTCIARRDHALQRGWQRQRRYLLLQRCLTQWRFVFVKYCRARCNVLAALVKQRVIRGVNDAFHRWRDVINAFAKAENDRNRDLQVCLITWQSYVVIIRTRRRSLRWIRARSMQRCALTRWLFRTRTVSRLQRLHEICYHMQLQVAFTKLSTCCQAFIERRETLSRICNVWRRAGLRSGWNQWKRKNCTIVREQITIESRHLQTANHQLMDVLEHVNARHSTRYLMLRIFTQWRRFAQNGSKKRRQIISWHKHRQCKLLIRSLHQWKQQTIDLARWRRRAATSLVRMSQRQTMTMLRAAWQAWQRGSQEQRHQSQLQMQRLYTHQTLQEMQESNLRQQREHMMRVAQRVMGAMMASWKRPTLHATFRAWFAVVVTRQRAIHERMTRLTVLRTQRQCTAVWIAWRDAHIRCRDGKRNLCRYLETEARKRLLVAFSRWSDWTEHEIDVEAALSRLALIVQNVWLRAALRILRVHRETSVRRQSVAVVLAAQSALQRHRKETLMRTVADTLQHRQQCYVYRVVARWRAHTLQQRTRDILVRSLTKRHVRGVLQQHLRGWRTVVRLQCSQRRTLERLRTIVWPARRCRAQWTAWRQNLNQRCEARRLLGAALTRCLLHRLRYAWQRLCTSVHIVNVEQWRRASMIQQDRVVSLEARSEWLLLESVQLKQERSSQRSRCMMALARRVVAVVQRNLDARLQYALQRWRQKSIEQARVVHCLLRGISCRALRYCLLEWRRETMQRSLALHASHVMNRTVKMWTTSAQKLGKKRAWMLWRLYARDRRCERVLGARVLSMCHRKHWQRIQRHIMIHWRRIVGLERHIRTAYQQSILRGVLQSWRLFTRSSQSKSRVIMSGARVLMAVFSRIQQRHFLQAWSSWRLRTNEAGIVLARAQIMLLELEQWKATSDRDEQALTMRVFLHWKTFACYQRSRRRVIHHSIQIRTDKTRMKRCFVTWRTAAVTARPIQKPRFPVLCVQAPWCRHQPQRQRKAGAWASSEPSSPPTLLRRSWICSLSEYRRVCRVRWRVVRARKSLRHWVNRLLALSLMLRGLRRHHHRVQRDALWMWFALTQRVCWPLTIASSSSVLYPDRMPTDRSTGRMLLVAIRTMKHREQERASNHARVLLNTIAHAVRGWYRRCMGRALRRWTIFVVARRRLPPALNTSLRTTSTYLRSVIKPESRVLERTAEATPMSAAMTPASASTATTARECAFLANLSTALRRVAFSHWKAQYIAWALERAERRQRALLTALQKRDTPAAS